MKRLAHRLFGLVTGALLLIAQNSWATDVLRMSTTTSTENSGLLTVLNPAFEVKYDIKLEVIAVGTGKALKMGGQGDVDVVFVHAPSAELKYVKAGDFIDRAAVMHNDFVIVGPKGDPAKLSTAGTAKEALYKISSTESAFISRGDDSGTHKKEKILWAHADITPTGEWYAEVGQGMGAVLNIANEKQAYALTDRGTQIAFADRLSLTISFEGDPVLFNPYHVMAVNPAKHEGVKYGLALKYIEFVTGEEGQALIAGFRKGDQQLFYPDAQ
ncbi:MAG: tungsten ABC transporter substrate-binding protein [Cycloclasticus sp. symbiont of Bathymodiolus heckerae]|nr:MAG: tungsten ABC transporter substrate-binding protein [Cycloclasticus sp. symbiont of Bathymodiolus heckerae]